MNVADRQQWAEDVKAQMKVERLDLEIDEFVILAGKRYYEGLIGKDGIKHYQLPYEGKRIGEILHFLNDNI